MLESSLRPSRGSRDFPDLWGKRILIVEDDPAVAVDYRFLLKNVGVIQTLVPSAQRAMAFLAAHDVDAAIVDYHLTDGPCTPVLELLGARHVPFVVVSGDTFRAGDVPQGALLLSKPTTVIEICQALSGLLH